MGSKKVKPDGRCSLKSFVMDEAEKYHLSESAVFAHIHKGKYPAIKLHYINKRLADVLNPLEASQSRIP